jgi:hypothetical protein
LTPLVVTVAVRVPGVGCVVKVIVNELIDAAVTVPVAPRLKARRPATIHLPVFRLDGCDGDVVFG